MKTKSLRYLATKALGILALSFALAGSQSALAEDNDNHGPMLHPTRPQFYILPPQPRPFSLIYGKLSAKWWQWVSGIPLAQNPAFDTTGEFGDQGQSGPVWFLSGAFGGTVERTVTVPAGKALFFPLFNSLWWAPNDLPFAREVAETYLGKTPAEIALLSDVELIGLLSNFFIDPNPTLTLTIDGVEVGNLLAYRKTSPGFRIVDRDLIDDLIALGASGPLDANNTAVSAGYWIFVAPLRPGAHEIHFTAELLGHPIAGDFTMDVTYHITVAPRR